MKNQESMVNISVSTLNALRQLLFSGENGVDLSLIVKDISAGLNTNEDLTAINVGLTFKGIKPVVDKTTRYEEGSVYWRRYNRCEFVEHSLILDMVKYNSVYVTRDEKTDTWTDSEPTLQCCSLSRWLEMSTSPDEYIEAINKKYPIDPFQPEESAE
jgi:hypothetical protein